MSWVRTASLGLALIATVAASVFEWPGSAPTPDTPEAATPTRRSGPAPAGPGPVALPLPAARAALGPPVSNLFAVHRTRVAAAAPTAPVAVPAPKAPPLPFLYLGKLLEQDRVVAFVSLGTRTHLLRRGDVVADYRVVDITASEATFVYLPLNEQQRLNFGSAN